MAYVTVKGTIEKFHNSGYGFTLLETYKTREGVDAAKKWQVFPEDNMHGHVPGDIVTVNGTVTAKVYTFTNDQGENVNIATMTVNNAKFAAPKTEEVASAVEQIGGVAKEEMPF